MTFMFIKFNRNSCVLTSMEQKGQNVDAEEHLLDKQSADDEQCDLVKQETCRYAFLCFFSELIKSLLHQSVEVKEALINNFHQ